MHFAVVCNEQFPKKKKKKMTSIAHGESTTNVDMPVCLNNENLAMYKLLRKKIFLGCSIHGMLKGLVHF